MTATMNSIKAAYWESVDAMTPLEKVARGEQMFHWTGQMLARVISEEQGSLSPERLRWEVALRMYGNEPQARLLIQRELDRVSG